MIQIEDAAQYVIWLGIAPDVQALNVHARNVQLYYRARVTGPEGEVLTVATSRH